MLPMAVVMTRHSEPDRLLAVGIALNALANRSKLLRLLPTTVHTAGLVSVPLQQAESCYRIRIEKPASEN